MQDHESSVRLEPRRDRPLHIAVVEDIDVLVDDDHLFHRGVRPEGGQDRVLAVPLVLLPDRDDPVEPGAAALDRKSTRLNSSHVRISYAVFCLKKKKTTVQY